MSDSHYRLAPGIEVVRLPSGGHYLYSDFVSIRLSGETAAELASVLGRLARGASLDAIASWLPSWPPESIALQIEQLERAGVLVAVGASASESPRQSALAALAELGATESAEPSLRGARVAIFGLEAHGARLALDLADAGVGTLVLVDPFPARIGDAGSSGLGRSSRPGVCRERTLTELVRERWSDTEVIGSGEAPLDFDRVERLIDGATLAIWCFDRGFGAAQHWINRAAARKGIPVLHSELRATSFLAGPLVLPRKSACFLCYRMRAAACDDDFERAMALEEHFGALDAPRMAERPILPTLPALLAATLGAESLRRILRLGKPTLVDRISEYDLLRDRWRSHAILRRPDCPVCQDGHAQPRRALKTLDELAHGNSGPTRIGSLAATLVSERTGIVTDLAVVPKDPSEPFEPIVVRARLANHRFADEPDDSTRWCSGKGFTEAAARMSCLGEAVERYGGEGFAQVEIREARAGDLEGRVLDPSALVLYAGEQYAHLPYAPYDGSNRLGWVKAQSLTSHDACWVPALAAFMSYSVRSPEEFLCPITSNGLAAGASLADAVLAGLLEVLERDAFLISWLQRLPARCFDPRTHPDPCVRRFVEASRRRGVRMGLFEMVTDHPCSVFAGVAFQDSGEGPAAVVGLGADLEPEAAARKAVLEVGQVRPALRRRARGSQTRDRLRELLADPTQVTTLDDHDLLYCDASMLPAFDFLFGKTAEWTANPVDAPRRPGDRLRWLTDALRSLGTEVLYVDLTPPEIRALGLFVARVIVPGFQPIWFGRRERRLGGSRLFELPGRLGIPRPSRDPERLHPLPHPLA